MAANGSPGNGWPEFTADSSNGINIVNGSATVTPGTVDYSVCDFWNRIRDAVVQSSNATVVRGGYGGSGGNATSSASASSSVPSASVVPATGGASAGLGVPMLILVLAFTTALYVSN